jgi:tryptophan synthase alpha chain
MNRIDLAFERLRRENSRALIAYLTAGDPTPDRTVELLLALERGGADIIELGVPFSDPTADGPVIQRASDRALHAGTTVIKILEMVRELRKHSEIPIVIFSYLNPILRYGFVKFAADFSDAGADGVLLTDLNVEAADVHLAEMAKYDLKPVFLVSQTTSPERLKLVADASGGFLYLVSTAGVTGVRQTIASGALPLVERARAATDLPLALGFGLSTKEHMEAIAPYADAAIVGSAFMRVVEDAKGAADLPQRLESLAAELKSGLGVSSS